MFFLHYIFKHIIPCNLQASKLPVFLMALWQTSASPAGPQVCWPVAAMDCPCQGWTSGCSRIRMGGTVQTIESCRKPVWVCTQTNSSPSLAPWEQEATKCREQEPGWDKQDVAVLETRGCRPEGLLSECLHAFKVNKESVCKRDPLMATKQTSHTRLGKPPWAGSSARKYHVCLPCFSSSLGT